ncbi:rho GTPase-activating protein SYDE2 isoform X2 [Denticeps clupeoides]|uniref:rho GTPase-activating protein SYDE2 isoform X2 n=1 Tax=Denticeps clupeoides TaxID=299321 RepID=UPI0010A34B9E|nr:rho GTPase-activating protein SYDE2 isoform X2 [Denticeps clupeoides]
MADPLRRTILAKLRGRKAKPVATEGKEKVLGSAEGPSCGEVTIAELDCWQDAVFDGDSGGVPCPWSEATTYTNSVRGRPGVSVQREVMDVREGTQGQRKTPVPVQLTGGDSIGFGGCEPVNASRGAITRTDGQRPASDVPCDGPDSRVANDPVLIRVIRNMETFPQRSPNLHSPTVFPTELEICDVNVTTRPHSLDSEDDDYYDNQILPFYEYQPQNTHTADISTPDPNTSSWETDRLRIQLKEAYHLLMTAVQDIGSEVHAGDKGSGSGHSRDSVHSQPSTKRSNCDAWSSGKSSPQQVSNSESPLLICSEGPLTFHKSCQNVSCSIVWPPLQRSVSDGAMKYPTVLRDVELHMADAGMDKSNLDDAEIPQSRDNAGGAGDRGGSATSLAGSSDNTEALFCREGGGNVADGGSCRTHGFTVNKMQEWMHRGRLLSSEMKQRIAGSSRSWLLPGTPGWTKAATPAANRAAPCQQTDGTEQLNPGFSPPSSPNPSKKGSSINWSFPDKIKSPRTVRKLSMKMKKLPELSRKLSVKGTPTSNSHLEVRANSPKNSCGTEQGQSPGGHYTGQAGGAFSSGNVISRYHLDSSVSTQHSYNMKSSGDIRSPNKGGYLSDGDSPELVAKSGNHCSTSEAKTGKAKDKEHMANNNSGGNGGPKLHGTDLDIDAFRPYSFSEQPKCMQYISGLMSLHFFGAEDLKPPHVDSRDVYCAIQVDSVNKARTALLTCRTTFLDMDHTFNIELENAQHLKLVVFSWEATPRRHRVCCHGTVVLPSLFRVTRTHQLAVRLEPRGMIYVKLGLIEQWQNSLEGPDGEREPHVFGVEAWKVVEREAAGLMVPLLIEKCIVEIEKRGCQVVGLYRLCGSAAVKKELREAFEQDSHSVELLENQYPDINVITGVLKDYLRELPYPLITKQLYEAVLDSMSRRPLRIGAGGCENDPSDSEHTVNLLDILPEVEKVTLRKLLDHLKLVASHHEVNKMTCQNLAVCFGPVLLSQRQDALCHSNRVFIDSEELASALHFKKHIEVLHYLLQLWPVVDQTSSLVVKTSSLIEPALPTDAVAPLRRRRERPQVLNLSEAEMAGMLRPKPGRLDSPCNRYAGDWSSCREAYLKEPREEADYDDIPDYDDTECSEDGKDGPEKQVNPLEPQERLTELEELPKVDAEEKVEVSEKLCETQMTTQDTKNNEHILPHLEQEHLSTEHTYQAYVKIQDISNTVNLKDLQESIDALIGNLERELNKNKLIGY